MPPDRIRAILIVLIGTGQFTKLYLERKRELSESEINFLIKEGYIIPCGTNSNNEILYCVSTKGKQF